MTYFVFLQGIITLWSEEVREGKSEIPRVLRRTQNHCNLTICITLVMGILLVLKQLVSFDPNLWCLHPFCLPFWHFLRLYECICYSKEDKCSCRWGGFFWWSPGIIERGIYTGFLLLFSSCSIQHVKSFKLGPLNASNGSLWKFFFF